MGGKGGKEKEQTGEGGEWVFVGERFEKFEYQKQKKTKKKI